MTGTADDQLQLSDRGVAESMPGPGESQARSGIQHTPTIQKSTTTTTTTVVLLELAALLYPRPGDKSVHCCRSAGWRSGAGEQVWGGDAKTRQGEVKTLHV
ncbi:hypothetical protein PoB_004678000 [Plakobranchus ocellatus]|uniref:Uncharacterized protein n=1 Tax=Plakobranchus ocellatus TaxID=259542 RepID=A0AAV4BIA6_9GAST|nr:hypothetical protein PoB_004678000 [Plakobranchus ocellatus]